MSSQESKDNAETPGGGRSSMVPAALAGAGILIVAGIFFFGSSDDDATRVDDKKGMLAKQQSKGAKKGGVATRRSDDAIGAPRRGPKLNPRISGSLPADSTPGRAPKKKEKPDSFESTEAEIEYWEHRVTDDRRRLEMRQDAVKRLPKIREAIRTRAKDPEAELAELDRREAVVNENLKKALAQLEESEDTLNRLK